MTPLETLQALARLAPERFRDVRTFLVKVNLVGNWTEIAHMTAEGQALLSAALIELVKARGWRWARYPNGAVALWGGVEDGYLCGLGAATDPFALVLARAVVQALGVDK